MLQSSQQIFQTVRRKKKAKRYKTRVILSKLPFCTPSILLQILPLPKRFRSNLKTEDVLVQNSHLRTRKMYCIWFDIANNTTKIEPYLLLTKIDQNFLEERTIWVNLNCPWYNIPQNLFKHNLLSKRETREK